MDISKNLITPKATVYHDGECPLCQNEISLMQKVDASNSIEWVDINTEQEALTDAGITFEQAMNRIHVADELRQMHTGVDGFLTIWQHLPYYRRLAPIVKHTPLLLPFLDWAYGLFAKHRLRITDRHKQSISQQTPQQTSQQVIHPVKHPTTKEVQN